MTDNPAMVSRENYQATIEAESAAWNNAAQNLASQINPDWREMQHLPQHVLIYKRHVDRILRMIQPGWHILEAGCLSGWLSLEMARRGAHVTGIDIAPEAIHIAREYAAAHPPSGSVEYRVGDMNHEPLEQEKYDLIVAFGLLYHMVETQAVLERFRDALKPSGRLYIVDTLETPRANALVAGALMMMLPTHLPYREKFRHLLRLRHRAVDGLKASMEARGMSPTAGGTTARPDPEALIRQTFDVTSSEHESAFLGYIISEIHLPRRGIIALGRILRVIDRLLVKLRLLKGLKYTYLARRRAT